MADGETFRLGEIDGIVLHTPGHTPACMVWIIGDALFTGDTLFRSEEHTSELQSLMRISYAVFCLKKKKNKKQRTQIEPHTKQHTKQIVNGKSDSTRQRTYI